MAIPEKIGRYRITAQVGRGGSGEVFRAWDSDLLRDVAIKRLRRSDSASAGGLGRLRAEARRACSLRHPAVVSVYDVITELDEAYLVEEFIEGVPLRDRLDRPFPLLEALTVMIPVSEALAALAERGIHHCDLKPENIMLEPGGQPRIVDFGLARAAEPPAGRPAEGSNGGRAAGTPGYIAPEVLRGGAPDARADVFSLGVCFYELLTARAPFAGADARERCERTLHDLPVPPRALCPALPERVERLVLAMIAPEPEARPSAAEVCSALLEIERELLGEAEAHAAAGGATAMGPWNVADRESQAVAVAARRQPYRRTHAMAPRRPLLHVEPFAAAGAAEAAALVAGGLTEAVRARLEQVRGLDILESSAGYSPSLVLSGTIEMDDGRLSVSCRILAPASGESLLETREEGDARHPLALRDRLCEKVIRSLARRFDLQIAHHSETVSLDRTAGRDAYVQGLARLRQAQGVEDRDAAIALFERSLREDPGFAPAIAGLALAHARLFESTRDPAWAERAEEEAHRAFALAPMYPEVRAAVAEVHLATGKASRAVRVLEEILEEDPGDYASRVSLARALAASGRDAEAEQAFLEAVRSQPDCWFAHNRLGEFYVRRGRAREALRSFLRVVELAPRYAPGYSNVGAAYQYLGRNAEAIEAYRRSVGIRPNYQALSNMATLLRSEGRLEEAARTYEESLALNDRDHRVWANLGATYNLLPGREGDAERCFRRAVALAERQREVNPSDPKLLANLAEYFGDLGQKVAMRQHIERALELGGDSADLRLLAASIYADLESEEDHNRACVELVRAIELGTPAASVEGEPVLREIATDPRIQSALARRRAQEAEEKEDTARDQAS